MTTINNLSKNNYPKGVFSTGEQTFRDIENFSRKISPLEHNSIETNYALQARLGNFWKNNPAQVLEFSKRFSGNSTIDHKPAPLGGEINYSRTNAVNRMGSGFFSDEFNFWDLDSNVKKVSVDNKIVKDGENTPLSQGIGNITKKAHDGISQKYNTNKEKFTDASSSKEENTLYLSCGCIFIFIIIAIIIYVILSQPQNSKLFGT
tara:strand:+ start:37 stop:651 length:615 start_codon:yes stop_codon:yes gene_type:complete